MENEEAGRTQSPVTLAEVAAVLFILLIFMTPIQG